MTGVFFAVGVTGAQGSEDNRTREKIIEWEKAALNREYAAETQVQQASDLLDLAREYRNADYTRDQEFRENFKQAGNAEKKAADLAGSACGNFDKAANNWDTVADECQELNDVEGVRRAREMATAAKEDAVRACAMAADAYEMAAQACGTDFADEPTRGAAASEKAATWREKLAKRR